MFENLTLIFKIYQNRRYKKQSIWKVNGSCILQTAFPAYPILMRNARFSYSRYYIYAHNWYMSVTLIPSKKSLQTLFDYFYLLLCRSEKRLKESKGKYSSRFQNRTSKILPLMKQRSQIFSFMSKKTFKSRDKTIS